MRKTLASLALALLFLAALTVGVWAQSPTGSIMGQVVNGTTGGQSPGLVEVSVQGFRGAEPLSSQTVQADAEGRFRVEGLETGEDVVYALSTEYLGIQYASDLLTFEQGASELQATLQVYETTTSDEAISLSRIHFVIDFVGGAMEVTEVHSFSNTGDKTYIGAEPAPGAVRTTVRFVLPEDATELSFEEVMFTDRYVETADGFADTEPVTPGRGTLQVAFSYLLPYDGSPRVLSTVLQYPAQAVNAFMADVGPALSSEQLSLMGAMDTGPRPFVGYVGQDFARGDTIAFEISGAPQEPAAPSASEGGGFNLGYVFIIGALVLFLVALAVAYPSLRRKQAAAPVAASPAASEDESDELLIAIADLDDAFEAGELNEEVYRKRRQALKTRLLELERLGGE